MRRIHFLLMFSIAVASCAGPRLSQEEARKQIAQLGSSKLIPNAIEIRRITSQSSDTAVAESTVTLAFQFKKDPKTSEWRVDAVRLGDRDWVNMAELLAAIDESRRRDTTGMMQKLAGGIENYRAKNGKLPEASNIVELTDMLHPTYMTELIRLDAWGQQLEYEAAGSAYTLRSAGPDRLRGTTDDLVVSSASAPRP